MVVGLLALLVAQSINPSIQIGKSRDARRKSDLKKIATSLEDYAGDKNCYPDAIYSSSSDCTVSAEFDPYIKRMPCDPLTNEPYLYERSGECKQFVIYAKLDNESMGSYTGGTNYVVTSPNLNLVPTSAESGGVFHGCFDGICRPIGPVPTCEPAYWDDDNCFGRCLKDGQPANQCTTIK